VCYHYQSTVATGEYKVSGNLYKILQRQRHLTRQEAPAIWYLRDVGGQTVADAAGWRTMLSVQSCTSVMPATRRLHRRHCRPAAAVLLLLLPLPLQVLLAVWCTRCMWVVFWADTDTHTAGSSDWLHGVLGNAGVTKTLWGSLFYRCSRQYFAPRFLYVRTVTVTTPWLFS